MSIGILPSVQNRAVKQGLSVCSRTTRLTNNQIKSRKKSYHSHKERESENQSGVAIVKTVPQLGCLAKTDAKRTNSKGTIH